jgi:hypothetical protein
MGRPFAEALLLRVADAMQRVTDWHRRAPDLLRLRPSIGLASHKEASHFLYAAVFCCR